MLGAFVIVLREVIEAGLIVGIVLAATRGVARAAGGSPSALPSVSPAPALSALFAGAISSFFDGYGQELFNAAILLTAVVHAGLAQRVDGASTAASLPPQVRGVGQEVAHGSRPLIALAVVCGVAVLREGSEVVLFLYGIVLSGTSGSSLLAGGLLGVAGGAAITGLSYLGLLAIPQRQIFTVTGWLITLLAAGMAAQAVFYLNAADVLTAFNRAVWDTSGILSQSSIPGLVLHTLVGYIDRPTGMQIIAYVATVARHGRPDALRRAVPAQAR